MVEIPGGLFLMGTGDADIEKEKKEVGKYQSNEEWIDSETPQHEVRVPPFFMGKFAVRQRQWREAAALEKVDRDLHPDLSNFKGDDYPVEQVSWEEAKEFCTPI